MNNSFQFWYENNQLMIWLAVTFTSPNNNVELGKHGTIDRFLLNIITNYNFCRWTLSQPQTFCSGGTDNNKLLPAFPGLPAKNFPSWAQVPLQRGISAWLDTSSMFAHVPQTYCGSNREPQRFTLAYSSQTSDSELVSAEILKFLAPYVTPRDHTHFQHASANPVTFPLGSWGIKTISRAARFGRLRHW